MAFNTEERASFSDDYLHDSFASVGNSTRSLLSPLLNEKLQIRSSTPEKENRREIDDDEDESYEAEKSNNMVLTSISLRNRSVKSSTSRGQDRSRRTSQDTTCSSFASSLDSSHISHGKEKEDQLSPWEDWLLKKTRKEREEMEKRKIEKWKEKRELIKKKKEEEEKRKKVEESIEQWNTEKEEKVRQQKEKKRAEMEQKKRMEFEKQQEIEKKAEVAFNKWLKEKQEKEQEVKKVKEIEEMKKKEKEVEKRMQNEQAFEEWLKKSQSHPKRDSHNYGHGVLKSYYDWVSYPMPSYINPMPWVQPVSKKQRETRQRQKELQPVSPPLLFRDYENRRTKKKNIVEMK